MSLYKRIQTGTKPWKEIWKEKTADSVKRGMGYIKLETLKQPCSMAGSGPVYKPDRGPLFPGGAP
jgi:hypothetical protein